MLKPPQFKIELKYRDGMLLKVLREFSFQSARFKRGWVCEILSNDAYPTYAETKWEQDMGGHNCSGKTIGGHGWRIPQYLLRDNCKVIHGHKFKYH